MSYSFDETYKGGSFRSHLTGRTYQFEKTIDGSAKRTAKAQMDADDNAYTEAANARARPVLGRELTHRELISGKWAPDPRPDTKERRREDVVVKPIPVADVEAGYQERIADLKLKLTYAPYWEKAQYQRRIDDLEQQLGIRVAEREAAEAEEERRNDPHFVRAVADAQKELDELRFRGDVEQSLVEQAQSNLERLQETKDVTEFKAASKQLTVSYKAMRQQQIDKLRERSEKIQADIDAIKEDKVPEAATS